jgi:hypothetical protein
VPHLFTIFPAAARVAAAGDILLSAFANLSVVKPPTVLQDVNLTLSALPSTTRLTAPGVTVGVVYDITLPVLDNESTMVSPAFNLSPADVTLTLPQVINASPLQPPTVNLSPPDVTLTLAALDNESTIGDTTMVAGSTDGSGALGEDESIGSNSVSDIFA